MPESRGELWRRVHAAGSGRGRAIAGAAFPFFDAPAEGRTYDEMYDLGNDPGELHNLAGQPRFAELEERLLRRIWRFVEETGDRTLGNAHYWSCRFFELGPNCNQAEGH